MTQWLTIVHKHDGGVKIRELVNCAAILRVEEGPDMCTIRLCNTKDTVVVRGDGSHQLLHFLIDSSAITVESDETTPDT
jgi:hypothetical protein